MRKIITTDREIDLKAKLRIYPDDLPNNTYDIKLVGNKYIDLENLNLNIVKYELDHDKIFTIHIKNCNMNKLILNIDGKDITIDNSNIQDIYIKSEIDLLRLFNTPLPNLHGNIGLINKIEIHQ